MKDILLQTGKIAFPQDILKPDVLTVRAPCTIYASGACPHKTAGKNDIPPYISMQTSANRAPTILHDYPDRLPKPVIAGCGTCTHALADQEKTARTLSQAGYAFTLAPDAKPVLQSFLVTAAARHNILFSSYTTVLFFHDPYTAELAIKIRQKPIPRFVQQILGLR